MIDQDRIIVESDDNGRSPFDTGEGFEVISFGGVDLRGSGLRYHLGSGVVTKSPPE